MEAVENGYFAKRIFDYLSLNNPDLLEDPSVLSDLTQRCIDKFIGLDISGINVNEATEISLAETLEGITSPYSFLKSFLDSNAQNIEKRSGKRLPESPSEIYTAALKNREDIANYVAAIETPDPDLIRRGAKALALALLLSPTDS
jgi:hypothetical protein